MSDCKNIPRPSAADKQWTHRQALQIIGQLPDDLTEAIAVLDRARFLLESWDFGEDQRRAAVLPLRPRAIGSD